MNNKIINNNLFKYVIYFQNLSEKYDINKGEVC